ncbi:MAG: hypothetical protein BWZ06_01645 [Bacteroidetes bacterium ADurb.BinA261]|nr:MAG: hypothetical protein BWZ06_01645 [Bacteroidetes bacterium ADurb.BinA261]
MSRMSFLPKKFGSTEEKTRTHFPANHIRPLVDKQRKIAIRLNPIFIGAPDNGFGSGTNHKFFFEFGFGIDNYATAVGCIFQTIMSNHSTFFSKTFHMFGFATQIRFWNKKRKIGINMSGFFKHIVELSLHFFPNCITVRFDDHTATYG